MKTISQTLYLVYLLAISVPMAWSVMILLDVVHDNVLSIVMPAGYLACYVITFLSLSLASFARTATRANPTTLSLDTRSQLD